LGVCDNIHCAWNYGVLPFGEYGNNTKFGNSTSFEDDTEIQDSPAVREERVGRWFRLLSADEQLDHFSTEYPIPEHELSDTGRDIRDFPYGAASVATLDTLRWQELNPLYLNPLMLQWCVFNFVLPASVVDDRKSKTITPRMPLWGPFKVQDTHRCTIKRGICKICGMNIGDSRKKEKVLSYRQHVAYAKLLIDTCTDEGWQGTAWDPNVELKWDDKKCEYRTIPTNSAVNTPDAPFPASSNPALVPSTTQAVDTAAVLGGQDEYLADSSTAASADYGLTTGWDWDEFVMDATPDDQPSATSGDNSGQNPGFFDNDNLTMMPQFGLDMNNDFSLDTGASFDAGLDTTSINGTGNQIELPSRPTGAQFNTFTHAQPSEFNNTTFQYSSNQTQLLNHFPASQQTDQPFSFSIDQNEHHMLFSDPDSISQDVVSGFVDGTMIVDQ
jgi:hypothetical protein